MDGLVRFFRIFDKGTQAHFGDLAAYLIADSTLLQIRTNRALETALVCNQRKDSVRYGVVLRGPGILIAQNRTEERRVEVQLESIVVQNAVAFHLGHRAKGREINLVTFGILLKARNLLTANTVTDEGLFGLHGVGHIGHPRLRTATPIRKEKPAQLKYLVQIRRCDIN